MKNLIDIVANPSALDSFDNYIGETDFGNLQVIMCRSRDSDVLTESNWVTALDLLGGESETVVIHRFGHWACGWWEALCVDPSSDQFAIAQDIEDRLASYPVLDEEDWGRREDEKAQEVWANSFNVSDRIEYIRNHRSQFDFNSLSEMFAVARGKYFNGYANELLG